MLKELLMKGYLPKELPSVFTSAGLSAFVNQAGNLPAPLTDKSALWTQPIAHNIARVGGLRRRLTTPNPLSFFRLARAFQANDNSLKAAWNKSAFSHTKPTLAPNQERAFSGKPGMRSVPKAISRVGARYLVAADISQFYPSVYTHTIPWAMHTKKLAKENKHDQSLGGNVIDAELRACQNGQTKGIAIGPDTSLGIAELILGVVDEAMAAECNILGGVRFIDDIEYAHSTLADAEHTLVCLEGLLHEYELQLNGNKTELIELPYELDSPYIPILHKYMPEAGTKSDSAWIDYFDTAFALAKQYPNDGVLRYAIAALQGTAISERVWVLAQSLLWQCLALDPGTLRFIVEVVRFNTLTQGYEVDVEMGEKAINCLIDTSATVGHGSEVAWGIWAASTLDFGLNSNSQDKIALVDDDFVAALALHNRETLFDPDYQPTLWEGWLVDECFISDHWLFSYEAYKRGWMQTAVAASDIAKDPVAVWMKGQGISFIRDSEVYVPKKVALGSGSAGASG